MENIDLAPGTQVLIKRARQGRFRFYGWELTPATVKRVTKTRIFIDAPTNGAKGEREFNRSSLEERGAGVGDYNRALLVLDPAEMARLTAEVEAERVRKQLEGLAQVALLDIRKLFDADGIKNRSDEQVQHFLLLAAELVSKNTK